MPQENLDSLHRLAEAFTRRDFDGAIQSFDENVEVRPAVEGVDVAAVYRGRAEFREFLGLIADAWETLTVELTDAVEAPGERVVAVERWRFRGRDGLALESELVDVYTFRQGLIVRVEGFRNRAEALEAVGVSE
jgi:ketosteroid isomerase-like protein